MAAYGSDPSGRRDTPAARRRARRRAVMGIDAGSTPPPKTVPRPKAPPLAPETSEPARHNRPWFEWRGWDSVVTYVVLAVMLAGLITGLHRLLAAGVFVIGASALAWGITHRAGRRRSTSGYGVLLDWLMGVLPRAAYLVLCVIVIVLGLVGLIAG